MIGRVAAEALGTALLLAAVVGSGIMGELLAAGNTAIALLANTVATATALYALITMFAPISGAHFNPLVTLTAWLDQQLEARTALAYTGAQLAGGVAGVGVAHLMFELPVVAAGTISRTGAAQWLSEGIAAFGLVLAIRLTVRFNPANTASVVACYIAAAYWFTASTSFANPAVTVARSLTPTFSGIRPADAPLFILAQLAGAIAAWAISRRPR